MSVTRDDWNLFAKQWDQFFVTRAARAKAAATEQNGS
jgi:hypothetical protein